SSGEPWDVLIVRPGREPLAALARMLMPLLTSVSDAEADPAQVHQSLIERLIREPGYLGTLLRGRAHARGRKILLLVDPFEELYTLGAKAAARRTFAACLAGVADDASAPLRVVVSLRSDFLDRVAEDRAFMAELMAGLVFLATPDRQGLEEALVQPAEMAGYRFESRSMVDHILDAVEATP